MNELALKDIHLPDVSLWWPPASGWWLTLLLVILLVVYLPRLLRWLRWKPVKTISLSELARIRADKLGGLDEQRVSQQISILLRRTVISYCGRINSAGVTGQNWVEQLRQLAGIECFNTEQKEWLSIGQYQPSARCDTEELLQSCETWIRALPRRNSNAAD